eukprot:m.45726 g.45726  ORF g.45726 m.45726 type:complete len:63 (+) comp8673_c0_seq2:1426-1614(+)
MATATTTGNNVLNSLCRNGCDMAQPTPTAISDWCLLRPAHTRMHNLPTSGHRGGIHRLNDFP